MEHTYINPKAEEFEMKKTITAYCFISGHIDFAAHSPEGTFGLAEGDEAIVFHVLAKSARWEKGALCVPGVRAAQSERERITAIAEFIQLLTISNQPGFRAMGA